MVNKYDIKEWTLILVLPSLLVFLLKNNTQIKGSYSLKEYANLST